MKSNKQNNYIPAIGGGLLLLIAFVLMRSFGRMNPSAIEATEIISALVLLVLCLVLTVGLGSGR